MVYFEEESEVELLKKKFNECHGLNEYVRVPIDHFGRFYDFVKFNAEKCCEQVSTQKNQEEKNKE